MFYEMSPGQIVDYCIEYNNTFADNMVDNNYDRVRIAIKEDYNSF
ncbi:MAG: hypothetical protein Q4E50_06405 [Tissierellia bacterium]|nr:hypothetical protein [Tissierellia bacterium]